MAVTVLTSRCSCTYLYFSFPPPQRLPPLELGFLHGCDRAYRCLDVGAAAAAAALGQPDVMAITTD
ncbi:hypothetical protein GE21DRAFT_1220462 [Neurospora crassa]|nr:hypothetical protein GE21DRAFT_1220462 [Neurospora crassa]